MGLIKGGLTLSRYRVLEQPQAGLTDEYVAERLARNAFVDIEETMDESSLGWAQIFNHLGCSFRTENFRFGGFLAFQLRFDERRLPGKTLNRYFAIALTRHEEQAGRKLNGVAKRELKESLRSELLGRSLLNTALMEVLWLEESGEVWLCASGEKNRALFEDLWGRTFGLALRLLVPASLALELTAEKGREAFLAVKPTDFWDL
ncbi:MAG: recombination-associated protein RdgC [Deltaproteobacteria bacterium]|jgi:DNA recombination-dependent growth factor C|nr:recombination-associated protein RdgC [Deltaproteobacteria bacterium]